MNDEIIDRMDLLCVYDNHIKYELINKKVFYVYVIDNNGVYYVGLTSNLTSSIKSHLHKNTNDLRSEGKIYILERLQDEFKMRNMEKIWIIWFKLNSLCINIDISSYQIRTGKIHIRHILNTNYKKLIDYEVIYGLPLLERQNISNGNKSDKEYFGKEFIEL